MARKTLAERVLEKCTPCGECLLWKGALACNGTVPSIYYEGATANVRNALWRSMGHQIRRGCAIKPSCGEPMCVAIEHLVSKHYRKVPKSPAARARTAKAMRARSNLTPEIVEAIRTSDEPLSVWAERTQSSVSSMSDVRLYRRWAPICTPFPFSQLVA